MLPRVEYTAHATDIVRFPWACRHCGHQATADVITTAYGESSAPLGIGLNEARQEAKSEAGAALPRAARALAARARCPSCGKTQSSRAVQIAGAMGIALAAVPLLIVVGGLLKRFTLSWESLRFWTLFIGVPLACVVGVRTHLEENKTRRNAAAMVEFDAKDD